MERLSLSLPRDPAARAADRVDACVVFGAADRREDLATRDPDALRALASRVSDVGRIRTLDSPGPG
jgi:hypothetical protein